MYVVPVWIPDRVMRRIATQGTSERSHHPLFPFALAIAGYSVLAALVTAPLLGNMVTHLWGTGTGDAWQNWWNGWWMRRALTTDAALFETSMLWHPDGVGLHTHTLGPLNAFLTAAGQAVAPGFSGYNALVLFHLVFAGVGGFVLYRHLLESSSRELRFDRRLRPGTIWLASFVGGAALAASPYMWAHFGNHIHVMSIGFLPLYAHALLRTLEEPGWRWPAISAAWTLGAVLVSYWVLIYLAILGVTALVFALARVRRDGWMPFLRVISCGALAGIVCAPFLVPVVAAHGVPLVGVHEPTAWSADLLSFWVPAEVQAIGHRFRSVSRSYSATIEESAAYMGYAALGLTAIAAARVRGRGFAFLLVAGLAAAVLALGPHPQVGGRVAESVHLPFAWMAGVVPLFARGIGVPVRLAVVLNLALGAGVALGAAWLASRARVARSGGVALAVIGLAGTVVVAEYWPRQLPSSRLPAPEWLAALREEPRDFAVADVTGWVQPLYNQTLHEHPIVGGYVSRRPGPLVDKLRADPVLGPLFRSALYGEREAALRLEPGAARRHLRDAWQVAYVIVRADHEGLDPLRDLDLDLVARSDELSLYHVRKEDP